MTTTSGKLTEPSSSFSWIIDIFSRYKIPLLLLMPICVASIVPELIIAGATSQFIDSYLINNRLNFAVPISWVLLISSILIISILAFQMLILRRLESLFIRRVSVTVFTQLFRLPFHFFLSNQPAEASARLALGMQIGQMAVSKLLAFCLSILRAFTILFFTLLISVKLTVISLLILVANLLVTAQITQRREGENRKLAMVQALADGIGTSGISTIESIKASALENEFFNKWSDKFSVGVNGQQIQSLYVAFTAVLGDVSTFATQAAIVIIGGFLILDGSLTLGSLIAFQFLLGSVVAPLGNISDFANTIQQLTGLSGRVSDVIANDKDPRVQSFSANESQSHPRLIGHIEGKNIHYRFPEAEDPIFSGLNFNIPAGTHLAIVGGSGSGKSTLLKMIAGFYSHDQGTLLYDGKPWEEIPDLQLRTSMAYVAQDVFLFRATIFENVTLWDPRFDQLDAYKALCDAKLRQEIDSYPDGVNRMLRDNGSDLSGGQKQRIEIARALIRDPSIILMDEATSALDDRTEAEVLSVIKSKERTLITVAHRMLSAQLSDQVIVLERGKIVQRGHPKELAEVPGYYLNLLLSEDSQVK
ncbi:MAG: ATP-binding cassette domain-containing protein [Cyanobacteria bacterium K_Offshore_surface_m2_239]|nr:ATP-binding cassette domain-containing protein [Cyanobacteria bacterium K_Offshore_surface_m2_239]